MNIIRLSLLLFFVLTRQVFAIPPSGSEWVPIPELTDEFNGDRLDSTKWFDHNPAWPGRHPAFFNPKNVSVQNGHLSLVTRVESLPNLPPGYHTFTSAAVKSRVKVLYGYFEINAKAMKSRVSSGFWFYEEEPSLWTEIDVFEIGAGIPGKESTVYMTTHVFRMPGYSGTPGNHLSFGKEWQAPFQPADEYHIYGLRWTKDKIEWFADGRRIRTLKNRYWHQPLYMNFDSETMPDWFGLPDPAELPATFSIDYVRSWKRIEQEPVKLIDLLKVWFCNVRDTLGRPCIR